MNTTKITGRDTQTGHSIAVTVENGVIARMDETKSDSDLYLSPGFVDLQVNGCAGFDLNAEQTSTETVIGLVDAMLAHGVTSFAPTLITAPEEGIRRRLKVIAEARRSHPRVAACVPFVHVEGPHISPLDGYRGVHPADAVRPPSIAEFDRWQDAAGGIVGMVTLSPHFGESAEYIAALVKRGVTLPLAIRTLHRNRSGVLSKLEPACRPIWAMESRQEIPRHRNPDLEPACR